MRRRQFTSNQNHACLWGAFLCLSAVLRQCIAHSVDLAQIKDSVREADVVFWLHIPKTGGTALASTAAKAATERGGKFALCYLQRGMKTCEQRPWSRRFRGQTMLFDPTKPTSIAVGSSQQEQPKVIFGHYTLADAEEWVEIGAVQGKPLVVVMVRHPLNRLFSGYQQVMRTNQGPMVDFDEFVRRCNAAQSRMMDIGPLLEYLGVDREHRGVRGEDGEATGWAPGPNATSPELLIADALAVLDRPDVIPLMQERWDESLELLARLGVAKAPDRKQQLNLSPINNTISFEYPTVEGMRRCIATEEPVYIAAEAKFRALYEEITGKSLRPIASAMK